MRLEVEGEKIKSSFLDLVKCEVPAGHTVEVEVSSSNWIYGCGTREAGLSQQHRFESHQ